jgi:hypothetical protein
MTTAPSSPPDEPRPPLARLVELAVVVPVEVGSRLIEAVPAVVDKVPSAAERVKREIVLARFLGKLVVDQGVRELRSRLTPERDHADSAMGGTEPEQDGAPAAAPPQATVPPPDVSDVPNVATLALADYDHLSSAQIVGKLDGLDEAEREAIERYETAGRHRRTILGKLEQLRTVS